MARQILRAALMGLVFGLTVVPATAQVQTGSVFGKVTDPQPAAIPGVTVTLEGPALIQPQTVTTSQTGAYSFTSVPIGIYSVRFEIAGFQRLVRQGIVITAGFNAGIDASLTLSPQEETVTVTGQSPVVDTRATTLASHFLRDQLENLPSARDPWVILEQTPGMVMTRQNVGGTTSGQQPGFLARGSSGNQMWNLDGSTITDMPDNTSSAYYDFDSFEEIQIQTGGNDASQDGGGVAINLVTKSGGNSFRGSSRLFLTDKAFQAQNVGADLRAQGAGAGNPLKNIADYGLEVGGPIQKNKAWFWGSYSKVNIKVGVIGFLKPGATDPNSADSLMTDLTVLTNANGKGQYQWTRAHKSTFLYMFGDKVRNARGAGPLSPLATTTPQSGVSHMYKLEHQWVVSDRFMVTAQGYTTNKGGYLLDFQSPDLANVQPSYDIVTGMNGRSTRRDEFIRPNTEMKLDSSYLGSGWLGGDHLLKLGVRYRHTPYQTKRHVGGGAVARFRNGVPSEAEISRDGFLSRDLWSWSAYLTDSYTRNRLTINIGTRLDYQDDKALATTTQANPILPDLLPALDFKGADSGARYVDVSPRLGATFALTKDKRTVLKGNLARYYGIGIFTSSVMSPTDRTWLRYGWSDLNGDQFVQRNELDLTKLLSFSTNYDPANPSSGISASTVDPKLKNDVTDEFTLGIEREIAKDFGVSATYIWRRYYRSQGEYSLTAKSGDFVPVNFTAACGNASCNKPSYSVTYWQLPFQQQAGTVLRNDGTERRYSGVEFVARKRFRDHWFMDASLTLNSTIFRYAGGPNVDYFDPTNIAQQDGVQTGSSNARWVAKVTGMYALPFGFSVAGFFNARDGFPFNRTVLTPTRTGGIGTASVLVSPYATERYQDFYQLDMRIDKTFRIGKVRLIGSVDGFNMLNSGVVLARTTRQNASNANNVTTLLAPRIVRFGVRLQF
jgi:hypothetical protein